MSKIVVIGSVNQDMSLSMSELPKEGDTVIADELQYSSGGKGANQAVALSRLGAKTSFVCAIGNDNTGASLVESLRNDQIDVVPMIKENASTGFAVISVDSLGKNHIVVYPGANYLMNREDIDHTKAVLKDAAYCVIQFELHLDIVRYVIQICKELQVPVVLNPAPYHESFDIDELSNIEYFIPNQNEFGSLFADKPQNMSLEEIVERATRLSCAHDVKIIVTLGSVGSVYVYKDVHHFEPAIKVNAVDTTAAGDTYIGAFVSQLYSGATVQDAMVFATKASSLTVSSKGAQESIPFLKDVV